MTVGFWSPLPPARTGVADYAAALAPALRRSGDVRIGAENADVFLYHLGNNQLHRQIYRRALAQPGVIVLHDAVLQHFFLGCLDERAYREEFVYNYGPWSNDLAADLYGARAGSATDSRYFQYPMLRRIVERSRAVVVHNPAAAAIVRRHAPSARVVEIPHLFSAPDPIAPAEAIRFRQRLGIPPCAFVFGVFGYLRESKRLLSILRALAAARRRRQDVWLLIAGTFASPDLERAVAPWLRDAAIRRLPYLAPREFHLAAAAVDACLNLRYPTAGETSGIAVRLMGAGKPVLLTDSAETSAFPEGAAVRIDTGLAEVDAIRDNMILFAACPWIAGEVGRRGAEHIAAQHAVERVAAMYWKVLCERSG